MLLLRASGMIDDDTDDEYEEYEEEAEAEEEEEDARLMQLQRGEGRSCAPRWH